MLRHVGVTRGQVLSILALEGGALTALGIATGFVLGLVISLCWSSSSIRNRSTGPCSCTCLGR
jgi:ABC-type antimicrobial peptide transport system permease subunit